MTTTETTLTAAYENEENIILNLSKIVNDYLLHNKPVDFITKQFFYAKCLVAELAKANIQFKVLYLGAGVRRITTNTAVAPEYHTQTVVNEKELANELSNKQKEYLWLTTFGNRRVTSQEVLNELKKNPTLHKLICHKANNKLTHVGVGTALGHLRKKVTWLDVEPEWSAENKRAIYTWFYKI